MKHWRPSQFFYGSPPSDPFALLVLNQPINQNAFNLLKRHASFIICADGGANRYFNLTRSIGRESDEVPNAIVGDLDSIKPDVRRHYEKLNVPVIENPDQYSTDFMKCLNYLADNCTDILKMQNNSPQSQATTDTLDVVVFGGLGGRVDQGFAQIHHLFCTTHLASTKITKPRGEIYLVSEESISFFLHQGNNEILTPGGSALNRANEEDGNGNSDSGCIGLRQCFSENIGIIPIGGPSVINTRGLEWDVHDWKTEFGGQLSTSNHIRAEVIEIETSVPVLFTVELAPSLKLDA